MSHYSLHLSPWKIINIHSYLVIRRKKQIKFKLDLLLNCAFESLDIHFPKFHGSMKPNLDEQINCKFLKGILLLWFCSFVDYTTFLHIFVVYWHVEIVVGKHTQNEPVEKDDEFFSNLGSRVEARRLPQGTMLFKITIIKLLIPSKS